MPNPDDAPSFPNDVASHLRQTERSATRSWHVVLTIYADDSQPAASEVKSITRSRIDSGEDFAVETLVDDRIVALFRHAGKWFAIDGMCSHQGGPLAEGVVRDGCVTCPWHGWQYDLATGIQMINRQSLQESFPVRQIENRIEVQIN